MNKAIQQFNYFAERAQQAPEFEQIKEYAVNDFFKSLPAWAKTAIAGAYARIERNNASAGDLQTIQMYYAEAEQAYRTRENKQNG